MLFEKQRPPTVSCRGVCGWRAGPTLSHTDRAVNHGLKFRRAAGFGPSAEDDVIALETFAWASVTTFHQPIGTCRVGADPSEGSRVRRFPPGARLGKGLCVAGASIMPGNISALTNLATVVIAERIASWLGKSTQADIRTRSRIRASSERHIGPVRAPRDPSWYHFGTDCIVQYVHILIERGRNGRSGRSRTHLHRLLPGWGPTGREFKSRRPD